MIAANRGRSDAFDIAVLLPHLGFAYQELGDHDKAIATFEEARRVIRQWLQWYNQERPHQALGYRSPVQYRAQQVTQVA